MIDYRSFKIKISQPALRALHNAGIMQLSDLSKVTETDVKKLHGMGPNALGKLRAVMQEEGLTFASVTEEQ